MSALCIKSKMCISKNFIDLFNKNIYEKFVLDIMNESTSIFPGRYSMVQEQSSGECDFEDMETKAKYDAKLPFEEEQIELLTDGKKHAPKITEWLEELQDESSFSPLDYRENPDNFIENTKLYQIMEKQIQHSAKDENIIFFLPYPITQSFENSYFSQLASDYLTLIYQRLMENNSIQEDIYAIYPSDKKSRFVVRNLKTKKYEYISNDSLDDYFSYEIVDVGFPQKTDLEG